ncbi:unnamed protein product [Moneuplotes crassus]|uniref:Uncharacterized protein n=1 Tax=Euplotes crassus TaxID=5936 RepID=A0AAD1XKT1_EUPCR|nr:unnamed protein product [Moneuplotes crassus]
MTLPSRMPIMTGVGVIPLSGAVEATIRLKSLFLGPFYPTVSELNLFPRVRISLSASKLKKVLD